MNKIIVAGDTLSAGVKLLMAVGVVYGAYRVYQFGQEAKQSANDFKADVDQVKNDVVEFGTETINPYSRNNFIKQSFVGDALTPVFDGIFDLVGVGK